MADRGPPYTGSFTTPPLHLDWTVHHTTAQTQRPATARQGAPRRPFSATANCPIRQVLAPRPRTARTLVVPASKAVEIPSLPATVATLSSNAIAEAALREQHLVKDADPLCGVSVEIRPLHATMPRGNRTADYYRARGYHYRAQGDFRAAIREYQTALSMAPRDFKALFNLGLVFDRLGETKQALSCYRRACKVDDQNMYLHFNMGICHLHDEEYDKAIGCFTRAIDVDGGCSLFFKNRAFAFRKAGRYAEAAKDYTAMGRCDNPEGYSIDLPLDADDDGQTTTNQDDLPSRTCPVYNGGTSSDHGLFYYDAKPLYTPRDSSIRARTTMDRTDPRICYKIAAAPPETRSDADVQFLMDYTTAFPLCKHLSQSVHRTLCTQVCGVRLTASTVLFQEDEPGAFVYLLLVGRINLFKHNLVKPDTADGSRSTVEAFLKDIPPDKLHTEAALIDLDNLRQQTVDPEETPMYTLRPGTEFGHQGRFRHLARACTAVVEADAQLIVVPWATVFDTEANESRVHSPDLMEYLGKLRLFRSIPAPELQLLTLKAKRLIVPKATVVQSSGQAHEGLLLVRRGMCKLVTHNSTTLGSRRVGSATHSAATKTGVKKTQQHNALHTYTTMEHEDSPVAFFHANQALTRHLMAVPALLRPETVHRRLVARDFVGEESFLSNETNRRVHATYTFTTDSECELIFLRKADFFADTSYYTRQRVRANIQHTATDTAPSPSQLRQATQQDRDQAKWTSYKQKLVDQVLHKRD